MAHVCHWGGAKESSDGLTHPSDSVDLMLPARITLGPEAWWPTRSMDSELVGKLVMLW